MTIPLPSPSHRKTRNAVHAWDRFAESAITVGGLSVIVAVLGICVFLGASVVPLFLSGSLSPAKQTRIETPATPLLLACDEYKRLGYMVFPTGEIAVFDVATGRTVVRRPAREYAAKVTAFCRDPASGIAAVGFSDGAVSPGSLTFEAELLADQEIPDHARELKIGDRMIVEANDRAPWGAAVERLAENQFRRIALLVEFRPPALLQQGSGAIVRLDYRRSSEQEFLVAARADGSAIYNIVRTIRPLGGGEPRVKLDSIAFELKEHGDQEVPDWMFVTGDGLHVLALWRDGLCQRYSASDVRVAPIVAADTLRVLHEGESGTCASMHLGGLTLLVGSSRGTVRAIVVGTDPGSAVLDGARLMSAHSLQPFDEAVTSIGLSSRDRCAIFGGAQGGLAVQHVTSEKTVLPAIRAFDAAVSVAAFAPKLDGVLAISDRGEFASWDFDPGHPESSLSTLFGKVHYEGAISPDYVYQSSSGDDAAEPKFSLIPLLLGTLKATAFAMLFAAPLAVLGAIYTSEFLDPGLRRTIKPAIELMASLPSVVLGFVAAIVVAPYVRDWLPAVLVGLAVVPLCALCAAHVWQAIPRWIVNKIPAWVKLALVLCVTVGGIAVSGSIGPLFEKGLFSPNAQDRLVLAGSYEAALPEETPDWVKDRKSLSPGEARRLRKDGLYFRDNRVVRPAPLSEVGEASVEQPASIRAWLDGRFGDAFPGWLLLMTPLAATVVVLFNANFVDRRFNEFARKLPVAIVPISSALKFGLSLAAVGVATWLLAAGLNAAGFDPRDTLFGPFSQRNALVVGLVMGFAVIPIIYTISEDALASVPASLRSASLGAGATRWQTSVRIVLPVAASGIFSACMIGLGRAAGETMIVVMATGNSPSIDGNIFTGFRTLSANIAVELPEAARDSTHYRILFLCGLVLFVVTFLVNTSAEVARQYFRRRNAAL